MVISMDDKEKKALCCFAVILATFYALCESDESKEEFLRALDGIKLKVLDDLSKEKNHFAV